MKSVLILTALAASAPWAVFAQVSGNAFGFAAGTTGGGGATPQYPTTIAE